MSSYEPTFTVSPARRPLVQRLTPLAWALIGVAGVVVALGAAGLVLALPGCAPDEPWWTPSPTPPPTETPVPPAPTATEWWEGMTTATPEPTPAFPAWWAGEMAQDDEGNWWPPDGVADIVREHHQDCLAVHDTLLVETTPPDLDAYEAALPVCTSGLQLEDELDNLADKRDGILPVVDTVWETCLAQIQDWNSDGLECTLGWVCHNGEVNEYDSLTGEFLRSEHQDDSGLMLLRMRYDPFDGHWKIDEFLDYVPPGG